MENKYNKMLGIIAVVAVAAILVTATAMSHDAFAKCKKKQSQSLAQANVCGNGSGFSTVKCQNLANQIQGDGNSANVIGVQ